MQAFKSGDVKICIGCDHNSEAENKLYLYSGFEQQFKSWHGELNFQHDYFKVSTLASCNLHRVYFTTRRCCKPTVVAAPLAVHQYFETCYSKKLANDTSFYLNVGDYQCVIECVWWWLTISFPYFYEKYHHYYCTHSNTIANKPIE